LWLFNKGKTLRGRGLKGRKFVRRSVASQSNEQGRKTWRGPFALPPNSSLGLVSSLTIFIKPMTREVGDKEGREQAFR